MNEYEPNDSEATTNMISQSEHPILFKPFLTFHPCKVPQVLSNFPKSQNLVLTFLTLYGPFVRLKLMNDYEKFYALKCDKMEVK